MLQDTRTFSVPQIVVAPDQPNTDNHYLALQLQNIQQLIDSTINAFQIAYRTDSKPISPEVSQTLGYLSKCRAAINCHAADAWKAL